jgi:hypothetical protein
MNQLHYVIIAILVIFTVSTSILFYQITALQGTVHIMNDTNQQLAENLTRYQDLIGTIPENYTSPSFQLKTEVYVAQAISPQPVTEIQVGKQYQIIANMTKMENSFPVVNYYCIAQVSTATGLGYHIGWGQGMLTPKKTFSQCAVTWTPETPGNYTISAFAWRSLFGSALSDAATKYVLVSSDNSNVIPVMSSNGTRTGFALNYTITGNYNRLVNATIDAKTTYILLGLDAQNNGTMTVTIPRNLLDAKTASGQDDQFVILGNGQEINYKQIRSTITDRTLTIPFASDISQIEIIVTQIV